MSSDYLADVQLPPEPEPELKVEIKDDVDIIGESPVEQEVDEQIPSPVKKEKLKKEDIFKSIIKDKAIPVIREIDDSDVEKEDIVPLKKTLPPKKPRPKKPKRKATPAQLAALEKGRATRALNKKMRDEEKAKEIEEQSDKVASRITEKISSKIAQEKKQEEKVSAGRQRESFTKKDLAEATFKAVELYDERRKKRKQEKKKQAHIKQHEDKVFSDINSALGKSETPDPYSDCFRFS